jgi:hypothetical protein
MNANAGAVKGSHGVVVAADICAGNGEPGEDALGARVSEYLGVELPIGVSRGVAAYRAGSGGGIGADLEFAGEQVLHAAIALNDHDQINAFNANLKSPVDAGDAEECWSAPTIRSAASRHAAAAFSAEYETAFDHVGHDGNALGVIEYFFRDASVGRGHDLVKDFAGMRQPIVCGTE